MLIIGHRGARGEAPENTLSGFNYLRHTGILRVELDIQVAADGELAVIHDRNTFRTTGHDAPVAKQSLHQLASLNACHALFPQWPESDGIPGLIDVMRTLQDFEHIQFEVKAEHSHEIEAVIAQLPHLIEHFDLVERCISTSFNPLYLQALRQDAPHIRRGLLIEKNRYPTKDGVSLARHLGCVSIGPHQELCTAELVEMAHEARLMVSTWTVNNPERMRELNQLGIHSIITDFPCLAQQEQGVSRS